MYRIINALMKEKGISAYRLAKDTGITPAAVSRWKYGATPSVENLTKISRYFNVPLEYFTKGVDGCTRQRRRSPGKPGCQSGQSGAGGKK